MIQDYFSLDKKGNNYLLLRIINKVDFEEEVVWARDFSLSDRTGISKPIEQLMSYLKNGLDSLSDWNGDMEGFHSSIQHFGFENLLRTDNLIPAFILREDAKTPEINLLIFNELEKERETLGCKELETKVGLLHEALSSISAKSYQPKDPEATVPVPLKLIFNKDWSAPGKLFLTDSAFRGLDRFWNSTLQLQQRLSDHGRRSPVFFGFS